MAEENKLFNFLTGIPFLMIVLIIVVIAIYLLYVPPKHNYVLNSQVLTNNSYLKMCNESNVCFKFNINVFPELNKTSTYQKEISTIELQRALLKKEIKLFNNLKKSKNNSQSLFDIAVWYIATSGINDNLNQLIVSRSSRLLAGYYYLKIFNERNSKDKETQLLEDKIEQFIKNNIIFRKFYFYLTYPPSRNLELPPTQDEKIQSELLEKSYDNEYQTDSINELCKRFDEKLPELKNFEKYAYLLATKACYKDLNSIQPEKENITEKINNLSDQIKTFKFKISNKLPYQ